MAETFLLCHCLLSFCLTHDQRKSLILRCLLSNQKKKLKQVYLQRCVKNTSAYFFGRKRPFCSQRSVFLQRLLNYYGFMKIQSAQYLPVSVEVGRVNTEKYTQLIQTSFLSVYFNENIIRCVFYALL